MREKSPQATSVRVSASSSNGRRPARHQPHPIREALLRLEIKLVVCTSRRSYNVRFLPLASVRDIYETLGILEGAAAATVASRLTETDLRELRRFNRLMGKAAAKADLQGFGLWNRRFHDVFLQKLDNDTLRNTCNLVRGPLYTFPVQRQTLAAWLRKSVTEHRNIIKLAAAGDARAWAPTSATCTGTSIGTIGPLLTPSIIREKRRFTSEGALPRSRYGLHCWQRSEGRRIQCGYRRLSLCSLLIIASSALAQGTTLRVSGTVTDSSGAIIPGATVTLTNDADRRLLRTVSTATGAYVFEAVQVGGYTLAVELQGFKNSCRRQRVSIGEAGDDQRKLDTAPSKNRSRFAPRPRWCRPIVRQPRSTFDQRTIESLPIVGAADESAGSGPDAARRGLWLEHRRRLSRSRRARSLLELHARRHRHQRNERWRIELLAARTNPTRWWSSRSSPATDGRIRPEQRREVAIVTRSGTNRFPGRRSTSTAARVQRQRMGEQHRQPAEADLHAGHAGFSVGGPIRRNKTFFFVNTHGSAPSRRGDQRLVYTAGASGRLPLRPPRAQPTAGVAGASVDANGNASAA